MRKKKMNAIKTVTISLLNKMKFSQVITLCAEAGVALVIEDGKITDYK